MVYILDLAELDTEDKAKAMADELVVETIEVCNSMRGRSRKIRSTRSKIKMVVQLSRTKKWKKPIEKLKESLEMLEQTSGEDSLNLFGI